MASAEQMQQMLDLLNQQMQTMKDLQAENTRLRGDEANGNTNNGNTGVTEQTRWKSKKPDRPVVNTSIDDRDWAIFIDMWSRYKRMCNLSEASIDIIRLELRACCSAEVNKLLFEYVGAAVLDGCTEDQLLGHMKEVAVKTVHKEVHRLAFHSLSQDQGESVTQFVARLKSKAFLCQFEIDCTCCTPPVKQNYAEEEVSQRLVTGLCNQEHQRKVLDGAAVLTTLEEKIKRLQILEATEESALTFHKPTPPSEAALVKSQYKAGKTAKLKSNLQSNVQQVNAPPKCRWCGRMSHPGGKSMDRPNCPAYKKKCDKCDRKGHFADVCEKQTAAATESDLTTEFAQEEQLQPLTSDASVSFAFGAANNSIRNQDFWESRNLLEET